MPLLSQHGRFWRVALLTTTLLMGVSLVVTGLSGYIQATQSAEILARSEMTDILRSLRRELSRGPSPTHAVDAFMAEANDRGVRYAALLTREGKISASFGTAVAGFAPLEHGAAAWLGGSGRQPAPNIRILDHGIVHAVAPIPRRMRRGGPFTDRDRPFWIAVEAVSEEGPRIIAAAIISLTIELSAALLLISAALLFWRQSVKQEGLMLTLQEERIHMVRALERDRRLKALGQMSAVLGHELRNPIAALKGHSQLLLERTPFDAEGRPQAETILSEAVLLEDLVSDILTYVRTGDIRLSRVYIDDLAHGVVALSGEDRVEITRTDDGTWLMDRPRMEQVLVNLLKNAAQASPSGAVIQLSFEIIEGETLEIRVRDFGRGVVDADIERVFEPFYTKKVQGTGLGLALAKRIVEGHGGDIGAENHPEGGAVFWIRLPSGRSAGKEHSDGADTGG